MEKKLDAYEAASMGTFLVVVWVYVLVEKRADMKGKFGAVYWAYVLVVL